jgi:ribose/xylose/arabinose/galactoside ABC-type transport system permease subunit
MPKPSPAVTRQLVNVAALVIIMAIMASLSPQFMTPDGIANLLRQVAVVITVGGFFTMLMVAGGLDLSVGAVIALAGIVSVSLSNAGIPLPVAFSAAILLGAGIGLLNGFLVAVVGVNALIVTLGMMYVARGLSLVAGEGRAITAHDPGYPWLGNALVGPIAVMAIAGLIALVVALILERRVLFGRYTVLVGTNAKAARLSGTPVRGTLISAFILVGAAAGWAGVLYSSRTGAAVSKAGIGFEFEVIIAALIGGTSLFGGEGAVAGTVLGALIVGSATTGMNMIGVEPFVQRVMLGVVLLSAVGFDAIVRSRRDRPTRRVTGKAAQA